MFRSAAETSLRPPIPLAPFATLALCVATWLPSGVAHAQGRAPTELSLVVSGGAGWLDGEYDVIGDRPAERCPRDLHSHQSYLACQQSPWGAPQWHTASLFAAGISFRVPLAG